MILAASGDALMLKRLPGRYPGFGGVADFLRAADARIANLETTLTDGACSPSESSGGTWLTAEPAVLDDLTAYGFNLFGWANNHTLDYSYDGLKQTRAAFLSRGIPNAGAGLTLFEANKPAVLDTPAGRVGLIAFSSTFEPSWRAGAASASMPGRPGLNPLRFRTECLVSAEHMRALRSIAESTRVNAFSDAMIRQGFKRAPGEGVFEMAGMRYVLSETEGKRTACNPIDLARAKKGVEDALRTCDYVVVMTHSHEMPGEIEYEADDFLIEFAHACVDAGACAVMGGGTHQLKGVELYQGMPICYSLGNFVFQNEFARLLPPEFMEKLGLPTDLTASEAIAARKAMSKGSLQDDPAVYLSALPRCVYESGRMTEMTFLPIEIARGEGRALAGLPRPARAPESVLALLERASAPFGTKFDLCANGMIRLRQ